MVVTKLPRRRWSHRTALCNLQVSSRAGQFCEKSVAAQTDAALDATGGALAQHLCSEPVECASEVGAPKSGAVVSSATRCRNTGAGFRFAFHSLIIAVADMSSWKTASHGKRATHSPGVPVYAANFFKICICSLLLISYCTRFTSRCKACGSWRVIHASGQ